MMGISRRITAGRSSLGCSSCGRVQIRGVVLLDDGGVRPEEFKIASQRFVECHTRPGRIRRYRSENRRRSGCCGLNGIHLACILRRSDSGGCRAESQRRAHILRHRGSLKPQVEERGLQLLPLAEQFRAGLVGGAKALADQLVGTRVVEPEPPGLFAKIFCSIGVCRINGERKFRGKS